jgi:hypothetical protein
VTTFEKAKFYWHRDRSKRFGASPDGFVDDVSAAASEQQRGLLEIKAPFRRVFDYIPPEYMCQMQCVFQYFHCQWRTL